jgi:hypothetical protein
MKITVIENLANDEYHNGKDYAAFWSSSNLKNYLKTPKEAKFQKLEKSEPSAAMIWGTIVHDFMFSKHKKGQSFDYADAPINPQTREAFGMTSEKYKEAKKLYRNLISQEKRENLAGVWDCLITSNDAGFFKEILTNGTPECSYFFEDGEFLYKTRHDVTLDNIIVDYKTLTKKEWSILGMSRRVANFQYDFSAAMYQYFEFKRTGIWKPFYLIWLMVEPPFDYLVMDISEFCYEYQNDFLVKNVGAINFEKSIKIHENCMFINNFPGITAQIPLNEDGYRIAKIKPAAWYVGDTREFEVNENEF